MFRGGTRVGLRVATALPHPKIIILLIGRVLMQIYY
jgi:hypothetical protein